MKCSKCGFENKDKAKFCTKCGNSLSKTETVAVKNKSKNMSLLFYWLLLSF